MLLHKQRNGSLENIGIVGVLNISLDHLRQQRWLRSVEVVDSGTIGNEAILLDKVKEVLNSVLRNLNERASSAKKTQDDPVRVPVVRLAEATTCNDERAVDRDETVGTIGAVLCVLIVATSKIRPNVNNLFGEFPNNSIVDIVEELRICIKVVTVDFFQFITSIVKVLIEEVSKS